MAGGSALLQMALSNDPSFIQRIQFLLTQEATVVLAEVNTTPNHVLRVQYARQVIQNAQQAAIAASVTIASSTNLVAANTTINPGSPITVTTDATDAAILAQISALWNALSGVST
jgi:hypothetical protein